MLHKRGIVRAFAGSDIYDFRKAHNSNLELESFSIGRKQNQRITLKALSCYHWGPRVLDATYICKLLKMLTLVGLVVSVE